MTEEEIRKLEPGEELDAAIAQYIFGATIHKASAKNPAIAGGCIVHWGTWKLYEPPQLYNRETQYVNKIDPYSTDISAAWQVVENDGHWEISKGSILYQAAFIPSEGPGGIVRKPTAPHAICIAALLAAKGGAE